MSDVTHTINRLEQDLRTRQNINNAVAANIIKTSMYLEIPHKTVLTGSECSSRKRRPDKPWWNDQLIILWHNLSEAEKRWLHCRYRSEKGVL